MTQTLTPQFVAPKPNQHTNQWLKFSTSGTLTSIGSFMTGDQTKEAKSPKVLQTSLCL